MKWTELVQRWKKRWERKVKQTAQRDEERESSTRGKLKVWLQFLRCDI